MPLVFLEKDIDQASQPKLVFEKQVRVNVAWVVYRNMFRRRFGLTWRSANGLSSNPMGRKRVGVCLFL